MKRRLFIKNILASGALASAISTGLMFPKKVWAAWNAEAFKSKKLNDSLMKLYGTTEVENSTDVQLKAPDIAENGAVVPISVKSSLTGIESISVFAEKNPTPLIASFNLGEGMLPSVSVRIKMGKTSNVLAIVKANGKLYKASKMVKVTVGGCGG